MVIKSGTNRFSGNGFYYWARQQPRGDAVGDQPGRRHQVEVHAQHLRRHVWRPDRAQQAVLLRRLPVRAPEEPAGRSLRDGRARRVAAGRSQQSALRDRRRPRSADNGQPFPNNRCRSSRFSPFARNLFANESLYPRPNVTRALSDFRQNYRGKTASKEEANQFDVKVGLECVGERQAVRTVSDRRESEPARRSCRWSTARRPTTFWGTAANWNRIIGRSLVNDLLVGFNDNGFNSQPLDIRGLGDLNNQLGIGGSSRSGPDLVGGQQRVGHRHRRRESNNHERGVSGQRAADVDSRPAHAEVRRVVEPLQICRTTPATTARSGSSPTTPPTSRAALRRFPARPGIEKGRGSWRRGPTPAPRRRCTRPTTSRRPTT